MLYPNRFAKPLPHLDDLNFRRIYPDGFSPGGIDVDEVTVDSAPSNLDLLSEKGLPEGTWARVLLPKELPAGRSTRLSIRYRLRVPEKFGSFGRYRGALTMSGGWYPYVASFREGRFQPQDLPPRSDFALSIRSNEDLVLNGRFFAASEGEIHREFPAAREISVSLGKGFRRYELGGSKVHATVLLSDRSPEEARRPLQELLVRWLEFVERFPDLARDVREVTVVQAPIREALIEDGEGTTYLSDRAFKLFPTIAQYHTSPIVRGLFYQLVFPQCSRRESSRDYDWVAKAVAWSWTERFMRENAYVHRDARTLGPVKLFSFLPTVDRVIYSPQFAFIDVFYDLIYPYDAVRDDALRFNHGRAHGRTVYAHLEDEVGSATAEKIALEYLYRNDLPLVALAEEVARKPLAEKFEQWIAPRPPVNYVLGEDRKHRTVEGYEYQVTVLREAEGPIAEPVELGVTTERNERLRLIWDGPEKAHDFTFRTQAPVAVLEVDPRGRLLETKLADNRRPPYYKLVLTDWVVNYDFNNNQPEGYIATQFRRSYGGNNRYNFSAAFSHDSYGAGVSYTRLFGRLLDRLRLSHGLSVGFDFNRLADDTAVAQQAGSPDTAVQIGPSGNITALGISYGFGNQVSFTNPLEGGGAGVSASWGSKYFGGDWSYYQAGVGGSWIFKLHPSHLLAVRSFIGLSGPEGIPSQIHYFLGGIGGVRGLSFDEDRFKGRNIFLSSAEYRHFLTQDVDWNLWIFRIREIQGALFTDAGRVTDTVQERANRIVFGSSTQHTTWADLFDVRHFQTDVGYGIRFHIEWLGVNPALFRFDAAKSLTEQGDPVRFYFGVTQSF